MQSRRPDGRAYACRPSLVVLPLVALALSASPALTVDNLTGLDYQEPLGYQLPQRGVRAGVRVGL
jgi:hypothetical protein